jgi:hypothetical protein
MAGVSFSAGGSTKSTEALLRKLARGDIFAGIERLAQVGVNALASATPKDSSLASNSWRYEIKKSRADLTISWLNSDVETGFPVALMLQYGYATGTGGYVQGRDYINPAMKPVFDMIANEVWKAVTSA